MIISISGMLQAIAEWISSSGIAAKVTGWIGTLGFSTLLTYAVWFEHHRKYKSMVKKIVKIIATVFIVMVALAFANEANMLPASFPIRVVW